ncbi:MAG TPA: hypothetical protein ENH82_14770 [bacterium]|nr:hypothetical protein [bacterium]
MIIVSEDGKSFVEISCWEDIITRPKYESKVDKEQVKLKAIIGKYYLSPKHPCGISSCGTAHNKGFLVVCQGGIETNIGDDCGRNIFGVDFKTLENQFNQDMNIQRYREKIKTYQSRIESYIENIENLKNGDIGGIATYEKIKWFMTKGFETKTLHALERKAKLKDNRIFELQKMDNRDIELARESGNYETHNKVEIGLLMGITAAIDYKKLKTLLQVHLSEEVDKFKSIDADTLSYKDLQFWHNWANRLDKRIAQAKEIIGECKSFLNDKNISTIRSYKTHLGNI